MQWKSAIWVPRTQGQFCAKSALSPSQWISFLGTVLNSAQMRAVVKPKHTLAIQQLNSKPEPLALSRHFKRCWASWPLRLRYFSCACFTCSPFSTSWDLMRALKRAPFEPLQSVDLSTPDAKNCPATSTSIGKAYGRFAGALCQPASNSGLMTLKSSWSQGMATYLKCSRLHSECRW